MVFFFDSHPSRANAVMVGENAVEVVECGPPCGDVIKDGIDSGASSVFD